MAQWVSVCDGVWRAESSIHLGPGFDLHVGSPVVRRADGSLVVISPYAFDDQMFSAIEAQGEVSALVAPNRFHHLAFPRAAARWPKAKAYAAPGLPEKRPDIRFDAVLSEQDNPLAGDLTVFLFEGAPGASELVLFHPPSRTLMLADLAFNLHEPLGWVTRGYARLSGMHNRPGQSFFWRFLVKDRAAALASARRMLALEPERVLPGHGAPMSRDELAQALRWMLRDG